jgi:hypothetical protein
MDSQGWRSALNPHPDRRRIHIRDVGRSLRSGQSDRTQKVGEDAVLVPLSGRPVSFIIGA